VARVEDCKRIPSGHLLHFATVEEGFLESGQVVTASVDGERRRAIMKNHTATHLLHKALRQVLGDHVHQAGSLVAPDRLRFDFTHAGAMTLEETARVEEIVNREIESAESVSWRELPIGEAKAMGAQALFGEKYGEVVRMVEVGDGWSRELCGGTHVPNVSQIQIFKLVSEGGIGGGVRRVEAVTGRGVTRHFAEQAERQEQAEEMLRARLRETERELEQARAKLVAAESGSLIERARDVNGVRVVAAVAPVTDMEALRSMTDTLRSKLQSGVVVLGATAGEDRVNLVAAVTRDLAGKVHAGKLIQEVAPIVGGRGGGRPDLATGGGKDPAKLGEALQAVARLVEEQIAA
jgi:alanyl-tRNA synthetase